MKCINCTQTVGADAKFCPNCGIALKQSPAKENIYVPLQRDNDVPGQPEVVRTVIYAADKNQGFLSKNVTIVVSSKRMIMANSDAKIFSEYQKEYKAKLEAEGSKGIGKFFSMATSGYEFLNRYFEMSPEAILAEREKNYQLLISEIRQVKLKTKNIGSDQENRTQIEMFIETKGKKYKYILNNATFNKQTFAILGDLFGARFDSGNICYY